jgi:hypothetical protein
VIRGWGHFWRSNRPQVGPVQRFIPSRADPRQVRPLGSPAAGQRHGPTVTPAVAAGPAQTERHAHAVDPVKNGTSNHARTAVTLRPCHLSPAMSRADRHHPADPLRQFPLVCTPRHAEIAVREVRARLIHPSPGRLEGSRLRRRLINQPSGCRMERSQFSARLRRAAIFDGDPISTMPSPGTNGTSPAVTNGTSHSVCSARDDPSVTHLARLAVTIRSAHQAATILVTRVWQRVTILTAIAPTSM